MAKNHHIRSNYITIIKMICRETNSKVPNDLERKSNYGLLYYMNFLLAKNNCIEFERQEMKIKLN